MLTKLTMTPIRLGRSFDTYTEQICGACRDIVDAQIDFPVRPFGAIWETDADHDVGGELFRVIRSVCENAD